MEMTLRELLEILDPPMTRNQLSTLITIAGIEPSGVRRTGRAGRPSNTYDATAVMAAHGDEARRTIKKFTDADWIGSALLARELIQVDSEAGEIRWPDGERAEKVGTGNYGFVHVGSERCPAHRIIWIASDGEIPPAIQVNHINQRRWDNRRVNLELVSFGNNIRHAHGKTEYVNYHDAKAELAALPEPSAMPSPAESLIRAGGAFRHAGN